MKQRVSSVFVSLLCISLSVIFFLQFFAVDAAAEDVVTYSQWSVNDTLSFFGNSFTGNVTVGGVEYSTTFNYIGSDSYYNYIDGINIESNDVINSSSLSSYNILVYKGTVSSLDGSNVRGDIYVPVDIFHSGGLRFFVGAPSNLSSSSTLDPSFVGNAISTNPANMISLSRAPASASLSDYYNLAHVHFRDSSWGDLAFQYRLLTYTAVDSSIAFFRFENIASLGRQFFIIIATPYSYDDVSHDSPVTTTVTSNTDNSAGTTVIVDVDVDMTETNSLLGQIKQAILGIVEGITNALKDLFIPDEEFLDDFKEDMLGNDQEPGFLEEHLGGLYQAIEAIGRIFDEFPDAVAATTIDIPACQIPLAGETLTLGPYSVPLIVEGLPQIFYDGLKFIIDFLCVAAFLNMCRNKLEIFLNPDSEVVQNDS